VVALIAALLVRVSTAVSAVPLELASERSVVSKPPPLPVEPPTNGVATVIVPDPPTWLVVTPVLYPAVPAARVLLEPGVVDAIVAEAVEELRPVLASFAHTCQPFLALVLTVAVRGVGLLVTLPVLKVPRASEVALSANENVEGTVAVTDTWSLLTVAVLKSLVSMLVGVLVRVVMVPLFELVALDLVVTAEVLVQLKQYRVPTVKSPLGKVTTWLDTFVAVAILGHAVPPVGQARLVVLTVKVDAIPKV